MNYDVQLNQAKCLIEKESIGMTIVTNVCTGKIMEVPWQIGDWANALGLTLVVLVLLTIVIFPIWLFLSGRIGF